MKGTQMKGTVCGWCINNSMKYSRNRPYTIENTKLGPNE